MNFSINKKLTKLLSVILVLCLMTTLFAGCMKKDDSEDTSAPGFNINLEDTTAPSETQTEPTQTEPAEINENMATILTGMNIRSSCSTDATIIGQLYAGDKVEIMRRETVLGQEWGYISSPEPGWILMEYVKMDYVSEDPVDENTNTPAASATEEPVETTPAATESTKGVISVNGLNIRSEASTETGKIVGSYNKGDVVTILETKNGWGRTNKGWIKMDFVTTSGSTATNNNNTTTNNDDNKTTTTTTNITSNGSTTVQLKGIVKVAELNIRSSGSTSGERLGSYTYGARVEILEKSGSWGRTSKGWICLDYIYQDGTTGSKTAKGVITAGGGLNIRSGPGTGYGTVGTYAEGESVSILEQFTYDGTTWGCTSKGWISMKYVDVDGSSSTNTDNDNDDGKLTGTITANGGLRIRVGPGSDYNVVGSLDYGDKVTILAQQETDGTTWGEIEEGWISMDYVDLD